MTTQRQFWAALLVAAMLLAFAGLAPASGHNYSSGHYNAPCSSGNGASNPQASVQRPTSGSGSFKAVQGTVDIENLYPCTGGAAGNWDAVNAANLQTNEGLEQLGYVQTSSNFNGFTAYQTDFWYTRLGDGTIWDASAGTYAWVDFNNDGTYDRPQIGKKYKFTITWLAGSKWSYCIEDVNGSYAGHTSCKSDIYRSGTDYAHVVWWSFENQNDASTLGADDISTQMINTPLQYMNSNGSIFSTVTDGNHNGAVCGWSGSQHWNSQDCYVGGGTGTSYLEAWTGLHTSDFMPPVVPNNLPPIGP